MIRSAMYLLAILILFQPSCKTSVDQSVLFFDDFEAGLEKWELVSPENIRIIDSENNEHKHVLSIEPGEWLVYALIRGSNEWGSVCVEGDVLFPEDTHNYLGLMYHFRKTGSRVDFGCIYIKGNDSYIRVNPHRDGNASRTLYEEYKTPLAGISAVHIGKWQHFKAEIMGPECHFYVGDMEKPKVIFPYYEFDSGGIGFKPRIKGSGCWIDNIRVKSISRFSYEGPSTQKVFGYSPEKLITEWDVIGPFEKRCSELENDHFSSDKSYGSDEGENLHWRSFWGDGRGCVTAGQVCEFVGSAHLAYFHTNWVSDTDREAQLCFSTRNPLIVWVNGIQRGPVESTAYAWFDFLKNPDHAGECIRIPFKSGDNHILILVEGGRYAGDGFFAAIR